MKIKYQDLIEQSFDWPQEEFQVQNNELLFHGIDLMGLVKEYGSPLKFTYLPKIGENINRVRGWFQDAQRKLNYRGTYHYCYVTKSNHFKHVVEEAVKNGAHIELSSEFDISIVEALLRSGMINLDHTIVCNGYKTDRYLRRIADLYIQGFTSVIPVIDSTHELHMLRNLVPGNLKVGVRIASEEEPKFEFYTSRLGIRYDGVVQFYQNEIAQYNDVEVKMLHFFVNTGIKDTSYYWNELLKCLKIYCDLAHVAPGLDSLNIGGGFPIKNSLGFDFDYAYMVEEILNQTKIHCESEGLSEPDIYTEFGSYTVGESGGAIYTVVDQKKQNDRERWNIIDSSFMTTLPDTWAINKRFIMLPLNRWDSGYERVFLGGITCDSDDYYNSEQHLGAIYLPVHAEEEPLYIGFFNTGAYQESIGGFGGIHHCLIPQPKHLIIDRDADGVLSIEVFSEKQEAKDMLPILGY